MNYYRKTRFLLRSLVFYFLFTGCREKEAPGSVSIQWENNKAVAILVPQKLLSTISKDSLDDVLQIRLVNSNVPVIGEYVFKDGDVIFTPMIAFTRGLKYNVYIGNELVDEIEIQTSNAIPAPEVAAVYPALDTLPENLLKFYIHFSKPMQEGDILKHIHLIKNDHDTLTSVFLDLELWNKERTMLTLWLDPGRIKRDLQPNRLLGPPLSKGSNYQLVINKNWQDTDGVLLKEAFTKAFFTAEHDQLSPDEKTWTIDAPKAGTKEELKINFHESLDHVLVENSISVIDASGKAVKAKLRVNNHGTIAIFSPGIEWEQGIYTLQIESRLEDLAGNNLHRLFDSDLTQNRKASENSHIKIFEIK